MLVKATEGHGIEQIGIVEHHPRWFLGIIIPLAIHHVEHASIGQILHIVDHRGSAGMNICCQLTYVGHTRATSGKQIVELLNLVQILQVYLLEEQNIHLNHHVYRLEQILAEIGILQEEGVISMMQITVEILHGIDLLQNLPDDMFVSVFDFLHGIRTEVIARHEVEILTEGKSPQIVTAYQTVQLHVLLLKPHHAAASEDHLQLRQSVMNHAQFVTPFIMLEHLVDE